MKKKNLLVLGDCASNGNNCLGHEVYKNDDVCLTFSLMYHQSFDDVIKWYIRRRKQGDTTSQSIDYRDLKKVAMQELRQQEKQSSWPTYLDYAVENKSINGNHFSNYIIQFEKFLKENNKPDLILITDYSQSHMVVYFTYKKQKYKFLCEPHAENEVYDKELHNYPKEVHDIKIKLIKKQNQYSDSYQSRKNLKYLKLLQTKLENANIPYIGVVLRAKNKFLFQNFDHVVDISHIKSQWCVGDEYDSGEICYKKFHLQKKCADEVSNFLKSINC